ncbi:MAG: Gmad2 immunoglobulin-like domain-containing protein [Patescibacteria group bacterium]
MSKRIFIPLASIALVAIVIAFVTISKDNKPVVIRSFEECVKAGYPVLESYPRRCKAPSTEFVEDIGNEIEKQNLIRVNMPRANTVIESPLVIQGEARGFWFFEASFPVHLFDVEGNKIATAIAQAQGEWMTEDFVPFEATLTFDSVSTERGMLIFQKDNPSGLPEHDDELQIPITFSKELITPNPNRECKPTGCSGQICSDEDVATTCEWSPVYSCYQNAECKRQNNGKCGFTETPELTSCVNSTK